MKRLKLSSLDARGIIHYVLPALIGVLVGLIGSYMVVATHADALPDKGHAVLTGHVSYGPTCPGPVRPGRTCTRPLANAHFIITNYVPPGSKQVLRLLGSFDTDKAGNYRVRLALSDGKSQQVQISLSDQKYNSSLKAKGPYIVKIPAGQKTILNMFFDTGLR